MEGIKEGKKKWTESSEITKFITFDSNSRSPGSVNEVREVHVGVEGPAVAVIADGLGNLAAALISKTVQTVYLVALKTVEL